MAVAIAGPKFYAFDPETGKPLAGGKLYTYKPGTTTNKKTFTDKSESAFNENPVILNAAGNADIYLVGEYDLVLTNDQDEVVWTTENYSSANVETKFTTAKLYSTTAFGLSNTEKGEYFTTPSNKDNELLTLWFHNDSDQAVEIDTIPNSYALDIAVTESTTQADRAESARDSSFNNATDAGNFANDAGNSAISANNAATQLNAVLDDAVASGMTFPLDLGSITESPVANQFDLGSIV